MFIFKLENKNSIQGRNFSKIIDIMTVESIKEIRIPWDRKHPYAFASHNLSDQPFNKSCLKFISTFLV